MTAYDEYEPPTPEEEAEDRARAEQDAQADREMARYQWSICPPLRSGFDSPRGPWLDRRDDIDSISCSAFRQWETERDLRGGV